MKKLLIVFISFLTLIDTAFCTEGPKTTANTSLVCLGNQVNVPVTITDFINVGGISLTLNYNAAILQYQSVTLNPAISGSFTNGSTPGVFLLSYTCDPGINLNDNDTLFTLNFGYTGPPTGGSSPITWAETPPEANEYSSPEGNAYNKDPFGNYFINGSVTVNPAGCGPVTTAPVISTCPSSNIVYPVTVTDFINVGGISLTLNYNAAILQYQSVTLNPAISGSFTNGGTPGVFLLSYTCNPGIDLDDNDTLFTLNFGYTGPPAGGTSLLSWAATPPEANEYSTPEGIAYNKEPFGTYFNDGSVTVDPAGCGPVTTAPVISTCPSSTIVVPITVTNFINVGGISLTLNYSAAILQYQSVTLNPVISGSFTNGSNPGVFLLSYTCNPGINLDDNDTLFTLNFSYVGPPAGGTSPLNWAANPPEANEYSTPEGIAYNKEPFGNYFINGSVTVDPAGCGPVTTAPVISTCPSSVIAVPVTVASFINVGAISLTLNYNASVLQYADVSLNPAIVSGSNYNAGIPGVFILGYFSLTGINLDDNDTLFTLYFKGCASGISDLTWDPRAGANEYASPEGYPYIHTPFEAYFIAGSVTVADAIAPVFTGCPASWTATPDPGGCSAVLFAPVLSNYKTDDGGWDPDQNDLWQSFTAEKTGILKSIRIKTTNAGVSFTLRVYEGEPTTGCNFGCEMYSSPSLASNGGVQEIIIPDGSTPYVETGEKYTIRLTNPTGDMAPRVNPTTYPGGLFWDDANDQLVPHVIPNGCPGTVYLNWSLWFETHVSELPAGMTITDNCTMKILSYDPPAENLFPAGSTTLTYTAADYASNFNTCSFPVIVVDDIPPVIFTCGPSQTAFAGPGCQAAVPDFTATTLATDNCSVVLTQVPAAGTMADVGTINVVITATDGAGLSVSCTSTFTVLLKSISGTLKYYNDENTPMNNITLTLNPGNVISITDNAGSFSFGNLCAGDYTISVSFNNYVIAGINSTDAAKANWWSVNASGNPIPQIQFMAGDVVKNSGLNSTDAQRIQKHFVYAGNCLYPLPSGCWDNRGPWVYWKTGNYINTSNPGSLMEDIIVTVGDTGPSNYFVDLQGMCTGDFNSSFTTSTFLKQESSTLQLAYGNVKQVGGNAEMELPIRLVNPSTLSAVSLILNFQSELLEVIEVALSKNIGQLDWVVYENELRIGWNSSIPLTTGVNEVLIVIKLKTTGEFSQGDEIRFTLAPDQLNELADGSYNIIPDAVLGMDVLEFSMYGINESSSVSALNLKNHPNPFSTYTTLTYTLPVDGHVVLQINDIPGRKVAILVDEWESSGKYSFIMDAIPLQPGIYIATLKLDTDGGSLIQTIKLIHFSGTNNQ